MDKLKQAWNWLKDNVAIVLAGIVAVLGAGWLWGYSRDKLRDKEDELAIEKAHREVEGLDAKREMLKKRSEKNEKKIEEIEQRRKEVVKKATSVEKDVSKMSDDEVEDEFQKLF